MPALFHGPRAGVRSAAVTASTTLNADDKVCQVLTPDAAWTVNINCVARAGFGFRIKNAATVIGRTLAITDAADAAVITLDAGEMADIIGNGSAFIATLLTSEPIVDIDTAAGTSHTGSTTEAVLTQYSIPASTIKAGTRVKVRFGARVTADNSTTTLTGRLRLGPTTLTGTELILTSAVDTDVDHWFTGEFTLVGRAAPGAAAALVGVGFSSLGAVGAACSQQFLTPTNFATNGVLLLQLTADWSAADANAVQSEFWTVEITG